MVFIMSDVWLKVYYLFALSHGRARDTLNFVVAAGGWTSGDSSEATGNCAPQNRTKIAPYHKITINLYK